MPIARAHHELHDLVRDQASTAARTQVVGPRIVSRHVSIGHSAAQRFARAASGPHGALYYKRITSEITGPLSGEWGPEGTVRGRAVGAGWRSGPPNTDLEKSMDYVGPRFHGAVQGMVDDMPWLT